MKVTLALVLAILASVFLVLSVFSTVPLWLSLGCLCGAVIVMCAPG